MIRFLVVILFTVINAILLPSCGTKVNDQADSMVKREMAQSRAACVRGECPCETPIGNIAHGSKITGYTKDSVACDEGCAKYAVEVMCQNGVLDKPLTDLSFTCTVQDCPSCFLGKNLILSGETVKTYTKTVAGCRESCEDLSSQRTCKMGVLSGNENATNFTCERKNCRCELPDSSGFVSLDGRVKLYSAEQAACGKSCEVDYSQDRQCRSTIPTGSTEEVFALDGNAAFRFRACREATDCYCTLPNNLGVIAHGTTKVISKVPSVPCAEKCESKPSINVKCDNGKFYDVTKPTQLVDFTKPDYVDFKFVCKVDDCVSCKVPGTSISILHGEKYKFAKKQEVGCSESCEFLDRTCDNGNFSGDASFSAPNCEKRPCKCTLASDAAVTIPVGSSRDFYSAALSGCGKNCTDISASRTCIEVQGTDGKYSYEFNGDKKFSFEACNPSTGCACPLPGDLGQVADGITVTLTSEKEIACGKTCAESPNIKMTCKNGFWQNVANGNVVNISEPGFPFKYFCMQPNCAACQLKGFGSIQSGSTVNLFSKEFLMCGEKPESFRYEFKCDNSVLLRNGNPYIPENDPNAPEKWFTTYIDKCTGCPLPWGGSIAEGGTVTAFKFFGTVINGCGRGCKSIQRKCEKGVLLGEADYTMSSCNNTCNQEGGGAPPRACLLPWQNSFVTPDAQIPVWSKKSVPCNDSCQKYFQVGKCDFMSGRLKVPYEYLYQSCAEICP